MTNLAKKIEEFQEEFKQNVPNDIQVLMENSIKELKQTSISAQALKQGDKIKDFVLPNALGFDIRFSEILKNNDFMVVNFYRGLWCPYCNLELNALQSIENELKELNTSLLAISPQTPDASLETKEKNNLSFEVLSDNKNIVAKEFGLVFSLDEKLRPIYSSFGIDMKTSNSDDSWEIPMPGTYLVNKNLEVIFAYIDEDHTKRLEPKILLDIIKENQ